ncbi:hypothetical protein ACLEPN_40575, partial [Myxococcus sp. 1LA]
LDAGSAPDAGSDIDAGSAPDAGSDLDAGSAPDAGSDPDAGTEPDPFTVCEGECQQTDITIQMNGNQRVLTSAYFGYEEPENPGDPWELWIELNNGAPNECPAEDSPLPPQLVNVYSVQVPVDATPQVGSLPGEPRATLIDFEGVLTTAWFLHTTNLTFSPVAASLCPTCLRDGSFPESHFVAFTVNGVYEYGAINGHGYATYCPSLNTLKHRQ